MSKSKTIRETILGTPDFRKRPVSIPEWGFERGLFVRSLSLADAMAFDRANEGIDDYGKTMALYLAFSLCDEDGTQVFDPATDADELLKKDTLVMERVFGESQDLKKDGAETTEDEGKILAQPLMRKAFELAERLGMTAFELLERMTIDEMRLWVEYDRTTISKYDYWFARLLAKLDWIKGVKRPDIKRYLPKIIGRRGVRRSMGEFKAMVISAVASSGGKINGG